MVSEKILAFAPTTNAICNWIRTNSMKGAALVMQRLSGFSLSFFARAESSKVLCRDRNLVGKELHDNATNLFASHFNIKKDARIILVASLLNVNFLHFSTPTIQTCKSSKHQKKHETDHELKTQRQ